MSDKAHTILVSHWGESVSSWSLLVDPGVKDGIIVGFSRVVWFPKSICTLERVKGDPAVTSYEWLYELTAPEWLLKKNNVEWQRN